MLPSYGRHPDILEDTLRFRVPTTDYPRSPSLIPPRALLDQVEHICKLREGDAAQIDRLASREPFETYLHVSKRDGRIVIVQIVAALTGSVTDKALDALQENILRPSRREDASIRAIVVYDGELASEDLMSRARREGVHLVSLEEYRGLIDFRRYSEWQNNRLKSDRIYPPSLYVEQRAYVSLGLEETFSKSARSELLKMLDADGARFVLVLGDFGTGKTFLLHEIARKLSSAEGGRLIPVLIEMQALEKARSLNALIAQHLTIAGMNRIDLPAFRYMLADGRIALLFDGFDELALRVSYERATEHFDTLIEASQGNAKVVVTSRSQHFFSDQQVRMVLANRAAELQGYRMIRLRPFVNDQIRCFLGNLLGSEEKADARFSLLQEVGDLLELSANPRMLALIAEVPEDQLKQAKERHETITAASLYQLLLDRWFAVEHARAHPKGAAGGLLTQDRWMAVTALALRLWSRTVATVNVSELPGEVADVLQTLSAHAQQMDKYILAHEVGSATLLVRDAEGNFSFLHQSVLEWLVARAAADEVRSKGDPKALGEREMSDLMVDFFAALARSEAATSWAERALAATSGLETINALRVLRRLGVETPDHLNLAGKDLRGQDLSGRNLWRADLRGADLREATLVRADLTGALLEGTKLNRADLSAARLVGADLRGADLSSARLLGADLRNAKLTGAQLRAAKLVGATIDADALDSWDAAGAALSAAQGVEPMSFSASHCNAVAWSPDGALLATGHEDGSVRLWETIHGTAVRVFRGHKRAVMSVAWNPQGKTLASLAEDGTVRLWNAWTGAALRTLQAVQFVYGTSMAWSLEGTTLAVGYSDGTARLWNAVTWQKTRTLLHKTPATPVTSIAWHPQDKMLATGLKDGTMHLWEVEAGALLSTFFPEHTHHEVTSIAFDPDGKTLASGSLDGMVRLWDVTTRKPLHVLRPGVAFDPDGKTLASGSLDGTAPPQQVLQPGEGRIHCVAFGRGGKMLASGGGAVHLWDPLTGACLQTLKGHEHWVRSVAWSPDGATLASGSLDRTVRLWDVENGGAARVLEGHSKGVRSVAWSPDGTSLASGSSDGTVRLWDVATAAVTRIFKEHTDWVRSVAWSPDGKMLASASLDRTVRLWDVENGGAARVLSGHEKAVLCVAWSPKGTILASGASDGPVRLWDIRAPSVPRALPGHKGRVTSVAWSPDGAMLASGSIDGPVRLWRVTPDGEASIRMPNTQNVWSVAWSPDGTMIAGGLSDGTVHLWDRSGAHQYTLAGHEQAIMSVAWSPDGATLASGSYDGTLRLWDVATRACRATLLPLPYGWAAFTKDGSYKLNGDIGGSFWHVIGLCRFEPGELGPYLPAPLRVPDNKPLFALPSICPPPASAPVSAPVSAKGPVTPSLKTTITVLLLAANPSGATRRALEREVREIQQRLNATEHRDRIRLVEAWAVRPDDLQQHLLRHQPDVIHWCGHGNVSGQLLLEDEHGQAFRVGREGLTRLCQLFRSHVRCVVLSACFSADQAREISTHIDCVVGMAADFSEDAAITFAGSFYQGLGFGQSVAGAFALGCNALDLKGLPGGDVPQLLKRSGVDPDAVKLIMS